MAAQNGQLLRLQKDLESETQTSKERIFELQEALHDANRSSKESTKRLKQVEEQLTRATVQQNSLEKRLIDSEVRKQYL
jgi:hypothetical protein